MVQSLVDEAIVWLEKARSANPGLPVAHAYLASAYAIKGETERAAAECAQAQRLSDNHYPTIASLKAGRYFGVPKIRALYETTFFVGLRKAECRGSNRDSGTRRVPSAISIAVNLLALPIAGVAGDPCLRGSP